MTGNPLTTQDYKALAAEKGLTWEGPPVATRSHKTGWGCPRCGHRWLSTYNNLERVKGCPACRPRSGSGKPKVEADYYALAETRGFEWIGDGLPAKTAIKTGWRCPQGHEWEATYNNISRGSGCPHCWRLRRGKKKK